MTEENLPKLARRKENRRSTLKTGRTISGRREPLEKAADRAAAHEKIHRKQVFRLAVTAAGFMLAIAAIVVVGLGLSRRESETSATDQPAASVTYKPTIEIIDEDATIGSSISNRIKDYVGQAEVDFRTLGLVPIRAVIPTGAIREIDFYLEDKSGFIKTVLDRGTGVTAEDAKRMLDYLDSKGVTEFEYIDVRIEGKAYWK